MIPHFPKGRICIHKRAISDRGGPFRRIRLGLRKEGAKNLLFNWNVRLDELGPYKASERLSLAYKGQKSKTTS